jgi:membrane associated rhomboid family serine protease
MVLALPYRTDSVLEHRPWGSIGLILANLIVALLLGFPAEAQPAWWGPPPEEPFINGWVLEHGAFDPLTWFTSVFVHAGWLHLIGNLFFLWTFSLVVEGYVGWRRFLSIYLAIGVLQCCIEQLMTLGADGGRSYGASAAIFGLMAIALVCAPQSRVKVVWFPFVVRTTWFRIGTFCCAFICLNVLALFLIRFTMSTAMMHLIGAAIGLAIGIWMLKTRRVNCDGWDLFSVQARGGRAPRIDPRTLGVSVRPETQCEDPRRGALVRIRDELEARESWGADGIYARVQQSSPDWVLPRTDLLNLIQALLRDRHDDQAMDRMEEYLAAYPRDSQPIRLTLAKELLRANRPGPAIRHLNAMSDDDLSGTQIAARNDLLDRARAILEKSPLELE